jgi:hypothetical protein
LFEVLALATPALAAAAASDDRFRNSRRSIFFSIGFLPCHSQFTMVEVN